MTQERFDDYTTEITIIFPQRTEEEMDAILRDLKHYFDDFIAPITGKWRIDTQRPTRESEWHNGRAINKRSYWDCARCGFQGRPGMTTVKQRGPQGQRREVCQECAKLLEAAADPDTLAAALAEGVH